MNAQYTQWLEMNRAALAPLLSWNELATATADRLARQGLTVAQDIVDLGKRQIDLVDEAKDPKKWAIEEGKLLADYGQTLVGRAGTYLDMSREIRESVVNWAESTAKSVAESSSAKPAA